MATAATPCRRRGFVNRNIRKLIWEGLRRSPEILLSSSTKHGRLTYSTKDGVIGRCLFVYGEFEYEKIRRAVDVARGAELIATRNEGFLIDVGAHVGTVCITMVRNRVFSNAIAIEPAPKSYRLLIRNISQNNLASSIQAVQRAVSSESGVATMELSPDNWGDHRVRRVDTPLSGYYDELRRTTIPVETQRLDTLLEDFDVSPEQVRLLWLDVQGHETFVLESGLSLLAAKVPVVSEFWPYGLQRAGISPWQYSRILRQYFAWFYDLGQPLPRRRPVAEVDSLFTEYCGVAFSDLLLVAK